MRNGRSAVIPPDGKARFFRRLTGLQAGNYDKTYYMEPGEGGAKAYALLRRAMEETGRVAVARVVIRTKESLAAIRVFQEGVLALETMHFPDEVRSVAGLTGIVQPEIRPQELQMAIGLIESLSGEFRPEAYQNEYRAAVLERIDAKVTGQEVTEAAPSPERGRVVDLMEALRASIRQAEEARGAEPAAAPMPAPPFPGAPVAPGVPAIPGVGAGAPAAAGAVPGLPGVPGAPRPAAVPPVPPAPGIGISAPLGPGAAAPGVPVPGPGQ